MTSHWRQIVRVFVRSSLYSSNTLTANHCTDIPRSLRTGENIRQDGGTLMKSSLQSGLILTDFHSSRSPTNFIFTPVKEMYLKNPIKQKNSVDFYPAGPSASSRKYHIKVNRKCSDQILFYDYYLILLST